MLSPYTQLGDLEIGSTPFGEGIAPYYHSKFKIHKHSTSADLQRTLGPEKFSQLWRFATVRNPYARTLSLFRFLKKWNGGPYREKIDRIQTFEAFVDSPILDLHPLALPQSSWIFDKNQHLLVNNWFAIEQIDTHLQEIAEKLNLKKIKLQVPRVNESVKNKKDLKVLQDAVVQEKIFRRYQIDFQNFGYPAEIKTPELEQTFQRQTTWWFKLRYLINKPKGWS